MISFLKLKPKWMPATMASRYQCLENCHQDFKLVLICYFRQYEHDVFMWATSSLHFTHSFPQFSFPPRRLASFSEPSPLGASSRVSLVLRLSPFPLGLWFLLGSRCLHSLFLGTLLIGDQIHCSFFLGVVFYVKSSLNTWRLANY